MKVTKDVLKVAEQAANIYATAKIGGGLGSLAAGGGAKLAGAGAAKAAAGGGSKIAAGSAAKAGKMSNFKVNPAARGQPPI